MENREKLCVACENNPRNKNYQDSPSGRLCDRCYEKALEDLKWMEIKND